MKKEQKIINEINNKYAQKLNRIRRKFVLCSQKFDLNFFQQTMTEYRITLKDIILEISEKYEELKNADFIMFNGSYARHSNIYSSDLDLNIMYKDKYRTIILPIELSINYILSKVLNFKGCDRIHSIMVYVPLIDNEKISLIDNTKLYYKFGKTSYFCRENYEKLLYETCNSTRDYNALLRYISSYSNKVVEEWESNFELIVDYGKYTDFENKIQEFRNRKLTNTNPDMLISIINEIYEQICNFNYLDNTKEIYIKDLKNIIKTIPLNILYKSLMLLDIGEIDSIKLDNLYQNTRIKREFINSIYYYLWILLRIQIIFEEFNYDLSSHSSKLMDINKLKNTYHKYYNEDIIESINTSLENLFSQIKKSLIARKEELNG